MGLVMKPSNLLIIMSDEHNPKIMGCSGHRIVRTPNIDRLAAEGTMFASAYTTSPVCVPARAAFAMGKYVHQIGYWDNADAYDGAVASWHHRLRERGHYVAAIGKLHFRGDESDDYGFDDTQIPMQIIEGISNWFAYFVPAGTPGAVIDRLNREVNHGLQFQDVKDKLASVGAETVGTTPAELAKFLQAESAKFAQLIKASGAKGTD